MNLFKYKKETEFSKKLLIQESLLIWITTLSAIILAFICVYKECFAELPWLSVLVGLPWTAYGISQSFYYKKAEKENTKNGIRYETIMSEFKQAQESVDNEDLQDDEEVVG